MTVYRIMENYNIPIPAGFHHFKTKKEAQDFQRQIARLLLEQDQNSFSEEPRKLGYHYFLRSVKEDCPIDKVVIKSKSDLVYQLNNSAQTLI